MVKPITGPFTKSEVLGPHFTTLPGHKPGGKQYVRTWYRQEKPFSLPLYFKYVHYAVLSYESNADVWYTWPTENSAHFDESLDQNCYNQAYSRFKGNLGTAAEMSVTVAERKQAIEMIYKRSIQLYNFARHLKNLNFGWAAEELGVKRPPIRSKPKQKRGRTHAIWKDGDMGVGKASKRTRIREYERGKGLDPRPGAKAFANNYLEFHFGWSPLVKDIGNAVEVLQGGVPPSFTKASASSKKNTSYWDSAYKERFYQMKRRQAVTLRAQVQITNPDLWLANQMGFVNPAKVAWELVPYSFVVDWFVNVSDFLGAATDFLGVDLINASTTVFTHATLSERYYVGYPGGESRSSNGVYERVAVERTVGISGPYLKVRPPWAVSPRRGLAAISLLLQQLK